MDPNRNQYTRMRSSGGIIVLLLSLILFLPALATIIQLLQTQQQKPRHAQALGDLAHKFGIVIQTGNETFPVTTDHVIVRGTNPDAADLAAYIPLFLREFTLYPSPAIKRAQLQAVVLCSNLSLNGQARAAVPDFAHNTLYLDVGRGARHPDYQRKVLHHEFFHIIDYKDDGQLYTDPSWCSLNEPQFHYGNGGINNQTDRTLSLFNKSLKGFVTKYAMAGVEEDKAETFAGMMVHYGDAQKKATNDPVFNKKFVRMKQLLRNFCHAFDENFWSNIARRNSVTLNS